MAITQLQEFPEARFGHVGPLLVSIWYSELSLRSIDALDAHQKTLAERYGKVTMISVVSSATKNPSPELREELKRRAPNQESMRIGNIVVVNARGLGAIIARTFLAALSLVQSGLSVAKDIDDAAARAKAIPGQHPEVVASTTLAADLKAFAALPAP